MKKANIRLVEYVAPTWGEDRNGIHYRIRSRIPEQSRIWGDLVLRGDGITPESAVARFKEIYTETAPQGTEVIFKEVTL